MTTNYPSALDGNTQLESDRVNNTLTVNDHAGQHNNISDAIKAIEAELGILPKGTYSDVKTRLNATLVNNPSVEQDVITTADRIPMVLQHGSGSFVSSLQEWRDNTGATKAFLDRTGGFSAQSYKVNGTPLAATNLSDSATLARLASPAFTGVPTAPTPAGGDNSTKIATTAFVVGASSPQNTSGLLSAIPSAASKPGAFYYAVDQAVLYFSDGSTWFRQGLPAGATSFMFGAAAVAPTGWVRYDGTNLPAATGIYADLVAHLGNSTTTPDSRGRSAVDLGTNTLVNAIGKNEGTTVGNRRGHVHRHTPHTHLTNFSTFDNAASNGALVDVGVFAGQGSFSTSVDGGSGVATDPLDGGAFLVGLLIAKL